MREIRPSGSVEGGMGDHNSGSNVLQKIFLCKGTNTYITAQRPGADGVATS